MSIKCGSCGKEFESVKKLWEHMIDEHNSPAFDGEGRIICENILKARLSKNKDDLKSQAHLNRMEEF